MTRLDVFLSYSRQDGDAVRQLDGIRTAQLGDRSTVHLLSILLATDTGNT